MNLDRRSVLFGTYSALLAGAIGATTAKSEPSERTQDLPAGAKSRFAQINNIRMHYVTMGSGPLAILLHGWPETWFAWHGIMPKLAERMTVVAPDLRGAGLTEITAGGYDKRTVAGDIRALAAHLGAEQAHIVGHDMGGKAAYVLAHLHSELVSKLVLVDCLVPGTENMDTMHGGAWHYGFHMAAGFPELLTQGREHAYIAAQIGAWCYRKDAIGEDVIAEYARRYAQPGAMTAGFNYYRALREDAALAATFGGRKLSMPVMAITGRHGVGAKLAASLEAQVDDLTPVIVEDCGHFVPEEAPTEFCENLKRFL